VVEALIEYLAGVSVRRVEDITEAPVGYAGQPGHGVQPQQEYLRPDRGVAEQPIEGEQPDVYLDGIVLKCT
jgi:hypothetical protein